MNKFRNNKANKKYKNLFLIRKSNLYVNSNDVNIVRNIKGIKYGIIFFRKRSLHKFLLFYY